MIDRQSGGERERERGKHERGKGSLLTKRQFLPWGEGGDENRGGAAAVSMPMPLRFLHFGSCRDKLFTRDAVIGMTGYHSITQLPTRSFIA